MNLLGYSQTLRALGVFATAMCCVTTFAEESVESTPKRFRFNSLAIAYSHSGRTDLERAGSKLADLSINHAEANLSGRLPFSAKFILLYGLNYAIDQFETRGLHVLPDRLEKVAVNLGVLSKFSEHWTITAAAQPGYYGNLGATDQKAFNLPGALGFSYSSNPSFTWSFGLRVDGFSRNPVLPALGASWQISDSWNFSLGIPRTALSWKMTDAVTVRALASFQGGSYRVKAPAAVRPGAGPTLLEYQEIRGGLGMEWALSPVFQLMIEGGSAAYRRFDYHEVGFSIVNGSEKQASYFTVSLSASF